MNCQVQHDPNRLSVLNCRMGCLAFKCSYTFKIYSYPLQSARQSGSHIFFLSVMGREIEALEEERRHTLILIFLMTCCENLELPWASPEHRFLSCTMRTLHGKHLVFLWDSRQHHHSIDTSPAKPVILWVGGILRTHQYRCSFIKLQWTQPPN